MSLYRKYIAKSSKKITDTIDSSLFNRTSEPSIAEFIVSGLKVIESLPYIKFTDWKYIRESDKIDIKLNRRHLKNRNVQKDKSVEKLVSIRDTAQEMIQLSFVIDYEGETRYIKKNLLIPCYIDDYHLYLNGKEVIPQKQIVDTSTYTKKTSVMLKTTLTPIDIYKKEPKELFYSTEGLAYKVKTFVLNLFTKKINPLYYYAARFGISRTINYFGMNDIIDVTDKEYDSSLNYYFRINNDLFVEVDKRFFKNSDFVRSFTYMIYELFPARSKIEIVNDIDYWLVRLGSIYTSNTKKQFDKGKNVLISFGRTLDEITAKMLRLDKKHLQSTYSLIRWELQNFDELRKKDNHDLGNKRLRCNEAIAFYFIQAMSQRINNLLNKKKMGIEDIERIFNWSPNELMRLMMSSKSSSLLTYDPDINDFGLLNALRFTFLGPQGISGGKNISDEFRDIYPSHLGRLDLNSLSHGDNSCLTGFLVPTCKVYEDGFFSNDSNDPDVFGSKLRKLKKKLFNDSEIIKRKSDLNEMKRNMIRHRDSVIFIKNMPKDDYGNIIITRRNSLIRDEDANRVVIRPRNKDREFIVTYRGKDGFLHDEEGHIVISLRKTLPKDGNVYIISKREFVETKPKFNYTEDGRILISKRDST